MPLATASYTAAMLTRTALLDGPVSVVEYHCDSGPSQRPVAEQHNAWSVSYVKRGSFGCRCCGASFELVPGSVLHGRPGDEYTCTHDHHAGGDECMAFFVAPEVVDEVAGRAGAAWPSGAVPPLAELIMLGELARCAAADDNDLGLDEVGLALVSRFVDVIAQHKRAGVKTQPQDRRRAIESALWIEAHGASEIDLQSLANRAGLSLYHYLRVFSSVLGVTPHQYLVRCRLRDAARLLSDEDRAITDVALDVGFNDLSNFVRSFHRAAGVSPRAYRRASRGDRKIFQERLAARA
jgi:AraC family transcriptional regulator